MRHLKHRQQLGVKKAHRHALMGNLAAALITHGRIQTTLAKAKALRPFIEKIITMARKAKKAEPARSVYLRRLAISRVRDKEAVKILFNDKADQFMNRNGGYTRIYKLGPRRGDAAEMALIEFIAADDKGYSSPSGNGKKSQDEKEPKDPVAKEKEKVTKATVKVEKKVSKEAEKVAEKKPKAKKAEK